jgi:hypothetical protein
MVLDYAEFYSRYNLRASARRETTPTLRYTTEFLSILVDQKVYNLNSLKDLTTINFSRCYAVTTIPYRISPGTRLPRGSPGSKREIIGLVILKRPWEHRHTTPSSGLKLIDGSSYLFMFTTQISANQ